MNNFAQIDDDQTRNNIPKIWTWGSCSARRLAYNRRAMYSGTARIH